MSKNELTNGLVTLAVIAGAGYLLYKMFGSGSGDGPGAFGGIFAGGDPVITEAVNVPESVEQIQQMQLPNVANTGYYNRGRREYVVTHRTPITTVVKKTGSNVNVFQGSPAGSTFGQITVGSPEEQIQQYNIAPKIIMVNGKPKKVM